MFETSHIDITVIDRSVTDAESIADTLRKHGIVVNIQRFDTVAECRSWLQTNVVDAIFIRYNAIGSTPATAIASLKTLQNPSCVILVEHYDRNIAASFMENGACDVISITENDLLVRFARATIDKKTERVTSMQRANEYQHEQVRLNWLLHHIKQPAAYLRDGIFFGTNATFDTQFGRPRYGEESLLDYTDKQDHKKIKQWLAGKQIPKEEPLLNVNWIRPTPSKQWFHYHHGTYQNENYAELLFVDREKPVTAPSTIASLTSEQFFDIVRQHLAKPETSQIRGWIAVMEIEQYHTHKRRAGWSTIEQTLNRVAEDIAKLLPPNVTLSHLGQETFVMLIESTKKEDALKITERVLDHMRQQPYTVGKQAIALRMSVGLAAMFGDEQDIDDVLTAAETACAIAQKNGSNETHLYDPERDADSLAAHEQSWIRRVQEALTYNLFQLAFQPIASLHANDGERYEVLVRIREKEKDIFPQRFLPAVQQTALIGKIDRWVVEQCVTQLKQLHQQQRNAIFYIKLSDATATDEEFVRWLEKLDIERQRRNIVFEIGQNVALAAETKVRSNIKALNDLNFQTVLEHVTGADNAIELIRLLGVQFIKIDGSLIHHLGRDKKKRAAIHKIAQYALENGKQIIAANVQDAESLSVLWQEGVHFIQGYYLQKPSRELDFDFNALI